ncbi:hypothetical protein ACFVZ3_37895 [Kitasatospora purpeofusca]|uniref:hypothetical protein n=1 Tax=Kitasatospora purpeofusca TaxID=67352 RepID=UPI0036A4FC04
MSQRGRRIVAGARARGLAVRGRVWAVTSGTRPRALPALGLLPPVLLAGGLAAEPAPVLWALIGGWVLALGLAGLLLRRPAGSGGRTRAVRRSGGGADGR